MKLLGKPVPSSYAEIVRRGLTELELGQLNDNDVKIVKVEQVCMLAEGEEAAWPLPTESSPTVGADAGTGALDNAAMWDLECWNDLCLGREISERYYNIWQSNDFALYKNVKFEIGSEKFAAHQLLLSAFCENASFKNSLNQCVKDGYAISLPEMDPTAFRKVLIYMYTLEVMFEDTNEAIEVLKIAKYIGVRELQIKSNAFLRTHLNSESALKIFCYAVKEEPQDEHLKEISLVYINRNINIVLSSDEFLKLSEEDLYRFLRNEDWYIENEIDVFKFVKRWAINKLTIGQTEKKPSGAELRAVMGKAFFEIRFTTLKDANEFFNEIVYLNDEMFTPSETLKFVAFLAAKAAAPRESNAEGDQVPCPQPPEKFNCNPRVLKSLKTEAFESPTSTTQDDDDFINQDETVNNEDEDSTEAPCLSTSNPAQITNVEESPELIECIPEYTLDDEVSTNSIMSECSFYSRPPKKRKIAYDNAEDYDDVPSLPSATIVGNESVSMQTEACSKDISLHDYVKNLSNGKDNDGVENINEVLKISTIPQYRVNLPNLKEFNLTLIPSNARSFECGSALKSYVKSKFVNLSDILFFDKKHRNADLEVPFGEDGGYSSKSKAILRELLTQKVNITLTIHNTIFLKVNQEDGIIIMNQIKDAQEILNGAREYPLKILAMSECEACSLEPLNRSHLEIIVLRRVKGLSNHAAFLKTCTNLRTVSWNDFGSESLDLTEDLLKGNQHLEKLSLAKCRLSATGKVDEYQIFLQELYLDNCEFHGDVLLMLPQLFPFVKRVQVYGKKCDAPLLHSLLQMHSLQWLFVWEFNYRRVKNKSNKKPKGSILTQESQVIQQFLTAIFDAEFAKKDKITFILMKKKEFVMATPSTSLSALQQVTFDPFNPSCWEGKKVKTMTEKFDTITELDFKHFSFDKFFSTYEHFSFFETTESDLKRKKKKKQSTTNVESHQKLNQGMLEMIDPISNSSSANTDGEDTNDIDIGDIEYV